MGNTFSDQAHPAGFFLTVVFCNLHLIFVVSKTFKTKSFSRPVLLDKVGKKHFWLILIDWGSYRKNSYQEK